MDIWRIYCKITLMSMPQDLIYNKSTSVQVMAWCLMAPSHYLNQFDPALWCHMSPPRDQLTAQKQIKEITKTSHYWLSVWLIHLPIYFINIRAAIDYLFNKVYGQFMCVLLPWIGPNEYCTEILSIVFRLSYETSTALWIFCSALIGWAFRSHKTITL